MPDSTIDSHIRFDIHPAHPCAVTAHLTGTRHQIAQVPLTLHGLEPLDTTTMILARIDHEEPYRTNQAATALHSEGITTEITPGSGRPSTRNGHGPTTQCLGAPALRSANSPTKHRRSTTTSAGAGPPP